MQSLQEGEQRLSITRDRKTRYEALWEGGQLLAVTVDKKGAVAFMRRLQHQRSIPVKTTLATILIALMLTAAVHADDFCPAFLTQTRQVLETGHCQDVQGLRRAAKAMPLPQHIDTDTEGKSFKRLLSKQVTRACKLQDLSIETLVDLARHDCQAEQDKQRAMCDAAQAKVAKHQ